MCVCIYGRPLGVGEKRKDLEIKEVDSSPNSLHFLAAGSQASLSTVQSLSFPPLSGSLGHGFASGPIQRTIQSILDILGAAHR